MTHLACRSLAVIVASVGILSAAPGNALGAGPQQLPDRACNAGTQTASVNAPTRTSAEAIPHVEHDFFIPVPYCHHFNPTAAPPPGL